ncbi:MAG: SGNH/GDSL hydrolase family protein [Verrucomicrobiales bacterium]|nr:SGNH/GDSL hydrolase family protein [Verrucomicrobiales bacterium]
MSEGMAAFAGMMKMFFRVMLGLGLTAGMVAAADKKAPNPVFVPVQEVAGLPRVLLIGDSISIGYTLDVRKQLDGVANVQRIPTNGGPTTNGLANLDAWLGDKKWDVIHFNWGLHDLKYMGPKNQNLAEPTASDSHQQVPPADYEKNLTALVQRLKKTGATLIWCSTTPVPEGARGRVKGDEVKYNEVAARVMAAEGVATDDLYPWAMAKLAEIQRPADVHYTAEGSAYLAEKVAASIREALQKAR